MRLFLVSVFLVISAGFASAEPCGFVTVSPAGTDFALYGQPFRYVGTNCYYLSDYGTGLTYDDAGNAVADSRQYVREVLDEAQDLGVKVIRTWAFAAADARQPVGGKHNLFEAGSPGNFQEATYRGLDYVVAEAARRGIRVLPVLVNNWDDCGGMAWYVQHSTTANQGLTGDAYHDQFYSDPDARQFYKNAVSYLLNRTNVYTGRAYKDDPTIFAWELANEARAKSQGADATLVNNWVAEMSSYVKTIDPNHLLATGIEGWGSPWEGTNFVSTQEDPNVDFATFHLYPDSWDWFTTNSLDADGSHLAAGIDLNKIDWWTAKAGITYLDPAWGNLYSPDEGVDGFDNWLKQNADWASELLGKPVILEEIGMLHSNSTTLQDRFYRQAIDSFFSAGGDGINLWGQAHDAYAPMDDGFLFYVSDDPTLRDLSQSPLNAIQYTLDTWADTPQGDPALTIVAEPAGLMLLIFGVGLLVRRR